MKNLLKKFLISAVSASMIMGFAGCTNGGEKDSGKDDGGSKPETYESYFNPLKMTDGELLVFGRTENLSTAQQYLAESIQGLFAQKGNSKYYHYRGGSYETWLGELETQYGKTAKNVTLAEMLEDYKKEFGNGFVLYNGNNRSNKAGETDYASINCARSIAGVKGVVMVENSLKDWAENNGLTQRFDTTEMTEKQCFNEYKAEFSNKGLVQQRGNLIQLTDFAIANKYFCYFVSSQSNSNLMFRNEVQLWCSGCPVYGWCPIDEAVDVGFSSRYDSFTLASDYCYNMSVFSCTEFYGKDKFTQPYPVTVNTGLPTNKHYITIVNSDGDNLQYWYGGRYENDNKWLRAERGDFAFGWSVAPSLYTLAPNILDHVYKLAKTGDTFVCSVSGLGYTYPMSYSVEGLKRYCANLNDYLEKCDLSVVKILDNGMTEQTIKYFSEMSNASGFLYCTYNGMYADDHGSVWWSENGKPFVSCRATMWETTPQAIATQINAYPADATTIEGYSYVNLHANSMNYNDVKAMVALLDDDVEVVDPETFIELIKKNVPHTDVKLEK